MNGKWIITLTLAALCGAAGAVVTELPAGSAIWPEHALDVAKAERGMRLVDATRVALDGAEGKRAAALLAAEPSPLLREWATAQVLETLLAGPPTDAAAALLDWAVKQPVLVYRQHEETRAAAYLPMFDIAQRARDVRRIWAAAAEREAWASRWIAAPASAIEALRAKDEEGRSAAADAVALLDSEHFAALQDAVGKVEPGQVAAELWLALAKRRAAPEWLAQALAQDKAAIRLQALALAADLPVEQAENLLGALEFDAELGSAASLALTDKRLEAGRVEALRLALADPRRRDATAAGLARALAQPEHHAAIQALRQALDTEAERQGWKRFLLLIRDPEQRARWTLEVTP